MTYRWKVLLVHFLILICAWLNTCESLQIYEFWFVILVLLWEIVVFSSAFCVLPSFVTMICVWICALQVISDLRKSLDLSSCVLPLQIHSSQKKIKSQVQARYLNKFAWFSKGRMRQENLNCPLPVSLAQLATYTSPIYPVERHRHLYSFLLGANTIHLSLFVQPASPAWMYFLLSHLPRCLHGDKQLHL